jgi:glycine/D-amino acid oxidase-like deaminating enzyme
MSIVRAWTGLSPSTDHAPILGEAPGVPGVFVCSTGAGYTMGPELGRMTAMAMLGKETIDPRYTLARFGSGSV